MPVKKITIEDLARMVKKGFDETARKDETATKVQIAGRFDVVEKRLAKIEDRLDNIEKLILRQHSDQIKNLQQRMERMEEMFAVK